MHDSELLRRYAEQRSEAAFRELVERHVNLVYGAALRQVAGDSHLAKDVAQKVFVALARKAGQLEGRTVLLGWLYTCTRLEAAQVIRTERRWKNRETQAYAMNSLLSAEPGSGADWEKLRPVLDDALSKLGEADREAVLLRFFSGQSFAEVGRNLQVSEEAARKRVDRALNKLRTLLGRSGIGSTSAALAGLLGSQAAAAAPTGIASAVAAGAWSELALGAGAAGSISASSVFTFMTATKVTVGLAALVVALAGISAMKNLSDLRDLSRRSATLERQIADLARNRDQASLGAAALEGQAGTLAGARRVVPAATIRKQPPALEAAIAREEGQRTNERATHAARHQQYARMYQQLGLSSDQIPALDAIMDQEQAPGHDPDELQAKLRDLLGDNGLKQYDDFKRSVGLHNVVDTLALDAYAGSEPFTGEQASQLYNLLIANDANYQAGHGTDVSQVDWDSVWGPASKVLSANQLSYFQATVEAQVLLKQVSDGVKATQAASGRNSGE